MKRTEESHWVPADELILEDKAMKAILAKENTLVIAGPGSGKTELLAQKACFLLQTGRCPSPKRILAISFKKDAAYNLKERVNARCGDQLSTRFESYTFDAFSKEMLDRFRQGLPKPYLVKGDYTVLTKNAKQVIHDAFKQADYVYFNTNSHKYEDYISSQQLPFDTTTSDGQLLYKAWSILALGNNPSVDFRMIMRLAQYILVENPKVRSFLHQVYSHIFLDEFQDTTYLQYDFLKTCFEGSSLNYTAVGDDKQRIMDFAGARKDVFEAYSKDRTVVSFSLLMNFRSAPRLVALQNYLVEKLLGKKPIARPATHWSPEAGEAKMCFFTDQSRELDYLISEIDNWIKVEHIPPRQICILVKQTPPKYTAELINRLAQQGIYARDETDLQDLLAEEATLFLVNMLTVVLDDDRGPEFDLALDFVNIVCGAYDEDDRLKQRAKLRKFCSKLKKSYVSPSFSTKTFAVLFLRVIEYLGLDNIKGAFPQYQGGKYLEKLLNTACAYLQEKYTEFSCIVKALNSLKGIDTIPVMTAHKSKGLEYHSVIFIGLEDQAFWTYKNQSEADNNLVFVALSRAKQRAIFTFAEKRPFDYRRQTADTIKNVHDLLMESGLVQVMEDSS